MNELKTTLDLKYSNGGVSHNPATKGVNYTCATTGLLTQQVTVGTAEEAIAKGDIATIQVVRITNLSEDNFVTYGSVTAQLGGKVSPKKTIQTELSANALFIKADTAPCDVFVELFPG